MFVFFLFYHLMMSKVVYNNDNDSVSESASGSESLGHSNRLSMSENEAYY